VNNLLKRGFDLTGRTAIVTGGTRGIGLELARNLLECGARVVITGRRAEQAEEVATGLGRPDQVRGVAAHMGDLDSIDRLVAMTVETFGGIDVIINNAANALTMPLGSLTPEGFAKSIDVNLRGPVFLVEKALPYLREGTGAAVLNVISPWAFSFSAQASLYAMGKAGLMSATRSMAEAYAPLGVRVNALAPGAIDTDMVRNNTPEAIEAMERAALLGRLGRPEEMVAPALLLVSDAGSYMTGQVLLADGGTLAY
jgi:NAD(P)-dependent dehydrogenase (short-subunit alcohol dehydrogenase family)